MVSWVSNTWFSNQTSKWANNLQSQHKSTIEKLLKNGRCFGVSINLIFLSTAINWWPLATSLWLGIWTCPRWISLGTEVDAIPLAHFRQGLQGQGSDGLNSKFRSSEVMKVGVRDSERIFWFPLDISDYFAVGADHIQQLLQTSVFGSYRGPINVVHGFVDTPSTSSNNCQVANTPRISKKKNCQDM